MAASAGKDILIQINTTGSTFVALGGLRQKELKFNAEAVDITNSDSPGLWREILAGTGVQSCEISGSGVWLDDAAMNVALTAHLTKVLKSFTIVLPGVASITGTFFITAITVGGAHSGEETFSITLQSSGLVTVTPA